MITPEDVIAEARSWVGTPFLHQGRNHLGIDCVGLVIVTMQRLGALPEDFESPDYGRLPNMGELRRKIADHCTPLPAPVPGALLGMTWFSDDSHVAVYTGHSIIHAFQRSRGRVRNPKQRSRVVEHSFRAKWIDRVAGVWALPGVRY